MNDIGALVAVETPATVSADPSVFDVIVIGAGMAGASVAYWLSRCARVLVLERESQPGYHTTGRSAAMYLQAYGSAQVRALSLASKVFFQSPPEGFAEHPLMSPRGALMVATPAELDLLDAHVALLRETGVRHERLTPEQACARVPVLRPEQVGAAVLEPDAADLDVHALHQGFLRGAKQHGRVVCNATVTGLCRRDAAWQVTTSAGTWTAPRVVNASGAWADEVGLLAGARPIGLLPCRRTAFTFAPPAGLDVSGWPMVLSAAEAWYFKPDAGVLLASPANADASFPHDVQPEEWDVALGIHRLEEATTLSIRRPSHTWAGLRSFVADHCLVGGFDDQVPDFFWLAGQGGYGIQTAPAMGEACASLVLGHPWPVYLATVGLKPEMLGPQRLWASGEQVSGRA
ncbi:MAG TPA: FAD-binding oxidoreductase [Burkholderiaceae bacterium]|nr:FAD-binding oxidoreductase [Burkholderiaceae bacterium]